MMVAFGIFEKWEKSDCDAIKSQCCKLRHKSCIRHNNFCQTNLIGGVNPWK